MLKTDKERIVAELAERLRASETLIVADYRGLTHKEIDDVRTELPEGGAGFSVVKNTLTRRAAEEAGVEALLELLSGPTAIAFVHDGDMVAVAKALDETARTTRRLSLKGGVLTGRSVDAKGLQDLATLPPAEVLRGQVLGAIVAPLTGLAALVERTAAAARRADRCPDRPAPAGRRRRGAGARVGISAGGRSRARGRGRSAGRDSKRQRRPRSADEDTGRGRDQRLRARQTPPSRTRPADGGKGREMSAVDTVFDQLGSMTVLELVELKKKIEDEWGITAAAPVAAAAAGAAAAGAAGDGAAARGEDRVRRRPDRRRRQEDPGDQGRSRGHRARAQGGQGPRRRRAEGRQGGRRTGGGRLDQGAARGGRRHGRGQVGAGSDRPCGARLGPGPLTPLRDRGCPHRVLDGRAGPCAGICPHTRYSPVDKMRLRRASPCG